MFCNLFGTGDSQHLSLVIFIDPYILADAMNKDIKWLRIGTQSHPAYRVLEFLAYNLNRCVCVSIWKCEMSVCGFHVCQK